MDTPKPIETPRADAALRAAQLLAAEAIKDAPLTAERFTAVTNVAFSIFHQGFARMEREACGYEQGMAEMAGQRKKPSTCNLQPIIDFPPLPRP